MDIEAYLKRINYHGNPRPDLQTLRALHLAHLYAVPFENLDVALQRPIVLNLDQIYDKVVNQRRGGICHELNGLFGELLSALGFEVQMLSAGTYDLQTVPGPELEHMLLAVNLDQRWIADVGFGDSFHQPLLLDETRDQYDGRRTYRIHHDGDHRILWARPAGKAWQKQYRFTLTPRSIGEYAWICQYRLTAPGSFFATNRICSLPTANGRITLLNDWLKIVANGQLQTYPMQSAQQYRETLRKHFGIVLPEDRRPRFLPY